VRTGSIVVAVAHRAGEVALVQTFFEKRRHAAEKFAASSGNETAFNQRQAADLEKFKLSLLELARSMHPAGKMVRRKGLAAMFT